MIERSRFASLLAIVAFLYVIIVLSKLNNPIPPDGQLTVASLYTVAVLTKGSLASTLAAVLTVPLCVTSVHADETYFRVDSSTGIWWPSILEYTTSIDKDGKITIRTNNTEKVKVTLAIGKSFTATVHLSPPSDTCDVKLSTDCTPTWEKYKLLPDLIQFSFNSAAKLSLTKDNPSVTLTFNNPGVDGVNQVQEHVPWPNVCTFDKASDLFDGKTVIFLQIEPVKRSECVMTMELESSTYLLLDNKYLPTTTAAITTLVPTNTTHGNSSSSTPSEGPPPKAEGSNAIIIGAACGGLLLVILIVIGIAVTIVCVRRRGKKRQPKKYQEEGQYHGIDSLNQSTVNKSSQADKSKKEKSPEPVAKPHGPRITTDANGYEVIFPATPQRGSPKQAATPPQDNSTKNPQPGTQNEPAAEGM